MRCAPTSFTITATAGANGRIVPTLASVLSGANQTFTIAGDAGYHVADVLVDTISGGAVTGYTFTNVQTEHTISASFVANITAAPICPTVSQWKGENNALDILGMNNGTLMNGVTFGTGRI